ncbi:hypothetical protein ABPG75_004036 [Micractinium tetrahymenae]
MEGGPAKPRGRRRPAKKAEGADVGAAGTAAAGAAAGARPAATAATDATAGATELTEPADGAPQPKPSLSQRVARSLRQLSQLGTTSKTEEAGEVDQQRGLAGEPAQPLNAPRPAAAAAAREEAEEEEAREWARGLGRSDESGGEEEAGRAGKTARAARRQLRRLRAGAADLGRRLSALHPAGLPGWPAIGRPAAAAALLALALLCGLLAAQQARANSRDLASLRQQVESKMDTAAAARAKLSRQLAEVQRSLESLDSRQAASATSLRALQASCKAQAGMAAELGAEVAAARADLAGLQAATAAAAAEAAAAMAAVATTAPHAATPRGGAAPGLPAVTVDEARVRQLARKEVGAELDLFAADRTGQPDWALAAAGAAVLAHSPAHGPPPLGGARLGAIRDKLGAGGGAGGVHPQANKLLLGPVSQPGACLPLVGPSGWVDIRLARPIYPSAFTYEHIPPSIAFDIRTAPRNLTLLGFLGRPPAVPGGPAEEGSSAGGGTGSAGSGAGSVGASTGRGVLLGSFAFDAHARRAVQTFPLAAAGGASTSVQQSPQPTPLIDRIRLLIASNHGHPGYTCLYRLRMHGTPLLADA